jgi:hypothetical protein
MSNHLYGIMTFDQMIKRMSKTQVHISDDETFVYSESFM